MSPAQAREIVRELGYVLPEAAVSLMVAATADEPSEARERAFRALQILNPDVPLPVALDDVGAAFGRVLVDCMRRADRREFQRLRPLLSQLLQEAQRIARREAAEMVA